MLALQQSRAGSYVFHVDRGAVVYVYRQTFEVGGCRAGWQGSPAGAELDALIQDEPIAAYQNLKDQLTQADKEDIARLIQLRAELNRSKT